MNIFVARLSPETTGDHLNEIFAEYGEVSSAKVIFDKETGNSRCFGFVEMDNDEEGHNAIENLNESELHGRNIVVKKARPREESGGGGGYNRNRGGGGGYNRGGGGGYNRGGGGGYNRGGDDYNRY